MIHDAMQCYQTAIKLRPDFAIAYGNLASCYYDCGYVAAVLVCSKLMTLITGGLGRRGGGRAADDFRSAALVT